MVFITEMGRQFPVIQDQTMYNDGFSSVYDDMTGDKMKRYKRYAYRKKMAQYGFLCAENFRWAKPY